MEHQVLAWIAQYGHLAIFLLLMLGIVGLPVPDETLLTFSGYLVYQGRYSLGMTIAAALAGSMSGITISYWAGGALGMRAVHKWGRYLRLTEERLEKAQSWFDRIGHWALTIGYFIPGVRHLTAFAAGMSNLDPKQFAIYAYSGAVIWVCTFIGLGYFLGDRWEEMLRVVDRHIVEVSIALGVAVVVYVAWWWFRKRRSS